MSRSGYSEDCDDWWSHIRWRGAVVSAFRGRRGQAFLRELRDALDALESKRLIANELQQEAEVCALGAVGQKRGIDMAVIDPEDSESVADAFGIAPAMAREIVYMNDEWLRETPEQRYARMRQWIVSEIKEPE